MTRLKTIAVAALLVVTSGALPLCAAEYVPGPDSLMLEVRDTVVVDEGYLYLHGHPLDPPYVFEIAGDSLYAELYVNDYIAQVIDRRPADRESLDERGLIALEIREYLRELMAEGELTHAGKTQAVAEVYRRHPELIDSVAVVTPGEVHIVVGGESGDPYHETVIVTPPTDRPPRPRTAW